jgi:hypothetical protein
MVSTLLKLMKDIVMILAGVYTKSEAVCDAKGCDDITVVPINTQKHNEMIKKTYGEVLEKLIL